MHDPSSAISLTADSEMRRTDVGEHRSEVDMFHTVGNCRSATV